MLFFVQWHCFILIIMITTQSQWQYDFFFFNWEWSSTFLDADAKHHTSWLFKMHNIKHKSSHTATCASVVPLSTVWICSGKTHCYWVYLDNIKVTVSLHTLQKPKYSEVSYCYSKSKFILINQRFQNWQSSRRWEEGMRSEERSGNTSRGVQGMETHRIQITRKKGWVRERKKNQFGQNFLQV